MIDEFEGTNEKGSGLDRERRFAELLGIAAALVSVGAGLVSVALGLMIAGILLACWAVIVYSELPGSSK